MVTLSGGGGVDGVGGNAGPALAESPAVFCCFIILRHVFAFPVENWEFIDFFFLAMGLAGFAKSDARLPNSLSRFDLTFCSVSSSVDVSACMLAAIRLDCASSASSDAIWAVISSA